MPRLPIRIERSGRQLDTLALVDSGAMMSVMPFNIGRQLGAVWDEREAKVPMGGIMRGSGGIPLLVSAKVGEYSPINLIFAWIKRNDVPLILGEIDFFLQFQVCFYRYALEFEVIPREQ
ncbi:MAG TPA: hypothetical protein VFD70_15340 [Anaerolineae bacterium]|nr:hypothetical protein [Anaerolineae bacterium]